MTTTPTAKTRRSPRRKTPQQRAQETLGVADRRLKKAKGEVGLLETKLETAKTELADAQARRDYAAKDPALKATPIGPGNTITGGQ